MYYHENILSRQVGQKYLQKHTQATRESLLSAYSVFCLHAVQPSVASCCAITADQDCTNTQCSWHINSVFLRCFNTACIGKIKK